MAVDFCETPLQNNPMKIEYASIPTDDQSLAPQRKALTAARCAEVFEDCGESGLAAPRLGLEASLTRTAGGSRTLAGMAGSVGAEHSTLWRSIRRLEAGAHGR
jgi:hypothetical protein